MLLSTVVIISLYCVKFSFGFHGYDVTFKHAEAMNDYLEANSSEISLRCRNQLNYYVGQLKNNEIWALQLLDANGKIPSGVLAGNLYGLGAFDQCLAVAETNATIFGQYCLGSIKLNRILNKTTTEVHKLKRDILIGICMPNGCSEKEITDILNGIHYDVKLVKDSCKVETETNFKPGAIITLTFFAIILCLLVASTIYHVFLFYTIRKPKHPLMLAFSVLKNGKQLFEINKNASTQISCLHGLRVLVTFWIIYIHQLKWLKEFALNNLMYIENVWRHTFPNFLAASSPVAVDTFFLIGGLVVSYSYLNSKLKNIQFNIARHYIHRYLRLTVVLSVMVLIMSTLFEHLGTGPFWKNDTTCIQYWWAALLYVQNYLAVMPSCMMHTWYLCVDMQLYFLSPFFLIPLGKWPKPTVIVTGCLAICTTINIFITTWILQFNAVANLNRDSMTDLFNYRVYYYKPTHTRGIPWFLGIILGYFIFQCTKRNMKLKISKIIAMLLWGISMATMVCCIFLSTHNTKDVANNRLQNALIASVRHPLWSMAVSWIIFACATGYGGPINWFLSLPIFEVTAKFSYSIYLVHYLIIQIVTNTSRTSIEFSNIDLMYMFWGHWMFSLGAAILLVLAFELPAVAIEKHFLSRKTV